MCVSLYVHDKYTQYTHINILYVTKDNKSSHKGFIQIYAASEIWINHISIDVWFGQYL